MALDYTIDVLPHLAGTNAATRDAINANMRHKMAANITALRKLTVRSGMVHSIGFGGASGIIGEAYPTLTTAQKALADAFLNDLITDAPYPSDTHDGGRIVGGIIGVAGANEAKLRNGYTAAQFSAEMLALTGGRSYGTVTTQDVADAIAAYEALQARQQLIADYEGALGQHVDVLTMTRAEVVAGMRAAADQVEGV